MNFQLQLLVQNLSGEGCFVSACTGETGPNDFFSCTRLSEQLLHHISEKFIFACSFSRIQSNSFSKPGQCEIKVGVQAYNKLR